MSLCRAVCVSKFYCIVRYVALGVAVCVLPASAKADTDGNKLFQQYLAEVTELKAQSLPANEYRERVAKINTEWQKRFMEFVSQGDPKDLGWQQVASELMALLQSSGNEDEALKINETLISGTQRGPNRLSLLMNKAAVLYGEFLKNPEDQLLKKRTGEAFAEVLESIDVEYALPARLSTLLNYGAFAQKEKEYLLAAKIYKKGNDLIVASKQDGNPSAWDSLSQEARTDFGQEVFLDLETRALVKSRKIKEAGECLDVLLQLPEVSQKRSYYFERFASFQDPQHGLTYQKLISEWLNREPKDATTASLSLALADASYRDGDFPAAAKIYSTLLTDPIAKPRKSELEAGKGGSASNVLYNLAVCLEKLGDEQQSKALFKSFSEMFPNDPRIEFLSNRLK